MCLAVPMTIVEVASPTSADPAEGVVELEGVRRVVRLELLDAPQVGDVVIVHAGYAIERLDPAEAAARRALFRDLAAHYEAALGEPVRLVAAPPAPDVRADRAPESPAEPQGETPRGGTP